MKAARNRVIQRNHKLLVAMSRAGKSARQISRETEVHYTTISLILNGWTTPKTETVTAIAKALGTTPKAIGLTEGAR